MLKVQQSGELESPASLYQGQKLEELRQDRSSRVWRSA